MAVFLPVAVAMPASFVGARDDGMIQYVRDLYVREVEAQAAGQPVSEAEFYPLFASELRALMEAPRPGLSHAPAGPILNAFFGWGVLPRQTVQLNGVTLAHDGTAGTALVQVDLLVRDEPRQVIVRPVRENGLWKIADISYDSGESLHAYYRRITRP